MLEQCRTCLRTAVSARDPATHVHMTCLLFDTSEGGCTVPGGAAIPGRCVEWTEQAPIPSPCSKNQFNIWSPGRGRIRY